MQFKASLLNALRVGARFFVASLPLCWLAMWVLADGTWRQAQPGYQFRFPQDHASHPEYKIEWWYYTGNLATREGQRFGYQLTFFRIGVDANPKNPSRWAVRDLFMAHFAISDVTRQRYRFAERLNRAGIGWAGASQRDYRVWNQEWEAGLREGRHQLQAVDGDMSILLDLESGKPPVIHGEQSVSRKGSQAGNASHYYSLARMPTRGELTFAGKRHVVEGLSWMDHEFGTSFLEAEQIGWDWFSIQLDDGADLMLFQLRRLDGSRDPHSSGTWIGLSGNSRSLGLRDFTLNPGGVWKSPESGASYPLSWDIEVPSQNLSLQVSAALPDQELRTERSTGVTYWEGSVEVHGSRAGQSVRGRGYLEMTGYSGKPMSEKFRE
jgi:predicted secreted hydrolase